MTLNNNSPTDNLIREKWEAAPERIWAWETDNWLCGFWQVGEKWHGEVRYIREDIHRAQSDRKRARIEALEGALYAMHVLARSKAWPVPPHIQEMVEAALSHRESDEGVKP